MLFTPSAENYLHKRALTQLNGRSANNTFDSNLRANSQAIVREQSYQATIRANDGRLILQEYISATFETGNRIGRTAEEIYWSVRRASVDFTARSSSKKKKKKWKIRSSSFFLSHGAKRYNSSRWHCRTRLLARKLFFLMRISARGRILNNT